MPGISARLSASVSSNSSQGGGNLPSDLQLLDSHDIAALLRKNVATVRAAITRAPKSLPPFIRPEGSAKVLWFPSDVREWLEQHRVNLKPKREAPIKEERLARYAAEHEASATLQEIASEEVLQTNVDARESQEGSK